MPERSLDEASSVSGIEGSIQLRVQRVSRLPLSHPPPRPTVTRSEKVMAAEAQASPTHPSISSLSSPVVT